MKIILPFFIGGPIDIYRFREYINRQYHAEITIIKDLLCLKITIIKGKIDKKGKLSIELWLLSSGAGIFITTLETIVDRAVKQPDSFLFEEMDIKIYNQSTKCSIYFFIINFLLAVFQVNRIEELRKVLYISKIKDEVINTAGIDFLATAKDELFLGLGGQTSTIIRGKKIKGKNIFTVRSKTEEDQLIFYLLLTTFHNRMVGYSVTWVKSFKGDILNLKVGQKVQRTIGWEWVCNELENKRLNFLDFLSYYRYHDCIYSVKSIPKKILEELKIDLYIKKIEDNIKTAQLLIEEISRMVIEKQNQTFNRHTQRLEYLITILGALGGIAAILAVVFGRGISLSLRLLAIGMILFIPTLIGFSEYLIRKKIKTRSLRAYINARIKNLQKEKNELEKLIKALKQEGTTSATTKEIFNFYQSLVEEKILEIEDLKKR